jgi:hypothetical protein
MDCDVIGNQAERERERREREREREGAVWPEGFGPLLGPYWREACSADKSPEVTPLTSQYLYR